MVRWFCVVGLCALGACNGKLAVLTEPVLDGQGGSGGDDPGDALAGASGEAREPPLCSEWDSSYPYRLDENIECGSCGCFQGDRSLCRADDCLPPTTIRRCSEDDDIAQAASVSFSRIAGTTWSFYIKGPGGCGALDFDVCYADAPSTVETYPHMVWLYALALTSAEDCDRMAFQQMQVDLSPLAEFALPEGGLVDTTYGFLAVGELTCLDRTLLASNAMGQELANADRRCVLDNDCVPVEMDARCGQGCALTAVRADNLASIVDRSDQIYRGICAGHEEECAGWFPTPSACTGGGARCRNGRCDYDEFR